MKVISIKGNVLTLELEDTEFNTLFRIGLQQLLDEQFGKKVVVLPVESFKITKKTKKVNFDNGLSLFCVETAVNQAIREAIEKIKSGQIKKPSKSKYNDAGDFA